jgi:tetratricopeptide (TPR) repeat protein
MPLLPGSTIAKTCLALLCSLPLLSACTADGPAGPTDKERLGLYLEGALGYFIAGDLDRAQQQVQFGLGVDEDNERLLLLLGDIHQQRGTTIDIRTAEAIFRAHPAQHDFRVRLGLGKALERMGVLYDEAASAVRSGKRSTEAPDPAARADELHADALQAWRESQENYEATLKIHLGEMGAIGGMVRVCALLGEETESVRWSRELIEVLESYNRTRHLELEDVTLAARRERELKSGIARNTDLIVKTLLHISTIHIRQNELQKAVDELGAVIAIDPELPQAYSRRAQVYFDLAQYQRASDTLQSFLKLSAQLPFDHPDIRQAYGLLRRCKDALATGGLLGSRN